MAHVDGQELADSVASHVLGWDEVKAFFCAPALMLVNDLSDLRCVGR
jgi:hypothetical protein